ncbi:bifunctional diaminohydroxyphosphoribosylaminopyrimidine deaminase/5-amino-6-(5-phosphoribosylamino)uracil reductase RibD [Agathobacter ruminis]|nr:bifunctional diaminohydroxyphosphoribosylaminopyrimidine deaminase/5-amino-6-(5-phosphoribosylamino)uracil reductase RibD [Agathobacter ruminis]MDC7301742.1 bifunctional diaminohydroxyphosphoribosylaminopyrimidine deaminase/5-amino-6-(5-phosphoribosylamino)uracil reductase RibD [Agathobacter ruminis]
MELNKAYMRMAIELAQRGGGHVHPNPQVGAVIVKEGRVIGKGYHRSYGNLHAEREALQSIPEGENAENATVYVTLEPCCHHGKQPPCTEALIQAKVACVVIGSRDPNPLVSGKGIEQLRKANITVVEDFMKEECDRLNPVFFHFVKTKRPYVTMKFAQTADGKIASQTGNAKWISSEKSRAEVQKLRGERMAILVGVNTVLADDPRLNCRYSGGRDPVRVVLDHMLRIPMSSQIVRSAWEQPTIVVAKENADAPGKEQKTFGERKEALETAGIEVLVVPQTIVHPEEEIQFVLDWLGTRNIDSILVEGGGTVNAAFYKAQAVDELIIYMAPFFLGADGISPVASLEINDPMMAERMRLQSATAMSDGDVCIVYTKRE